jgi:hypothetical protein
LRQACFEDLTRVAVEHGKLGDVDRNTSGYASQPGSPGLSAALRAAVPAAVHGLPH